MFTRCSFSLCIALALAVLGPSAPAQTPLVSPDQSIRVVTSDVTLFWRAWDIWQTRDHGDPQRLASVLQAVYLDKGSPGVKAFTPNRIRSASDLADTILRDVDYYREQRPVTEHLAADADALQPAIKALREIDPQAKLPTVYVVIGARNSGGTSTRAGLILGAEMFSPRPASRLHPDDLWPMAAHELIHYQQKTSGHTLLSQAMDEGAADFFAERLTGHNPDRNLQVYGDAHEPELWREFNSARNGKDLSAWLYNGSSEQFHGTGRPPDLGYYIGYRIAQAYLQSHADKAAALRTLLIMHDPEAILADSRYAERFR